MNQLTYFDRYHLGKLFEVGSFSHIRELGREVQFIERFLSYKSSRNPVNNSASTASSIQFKNNFTNYVSKHYSYYVINIKESMVLT